jgi:hypothetical protein
MTEKKEIKRYFMPVAAKRRLNKEDGIEWTDRRERATKALLDALPDDEVDRIAERARKHRKKSD